MLFKRLEDALEEDIKEQSTKGGFFGHLSSLYDKLFSSSEDGILKDFTPKAIEKAQNIMKDRIKTGVPKKGTIKIGL